MTLEPFNDTDDRPDYPVGFWTWLMLDVQIGDVIGLRWHEDKERYYYEPDANGLNPMMNDGYTIDRETALKMSDAAIKAIPNQPKHKSLMRFSKFCTDSGGFKIY